jgi:hypothetical protein
VHSQPQRGVPRDSEDRPACDAKVPTEGLDVREEMLSGVDAQVSAWVACQGTAVSATTLMEHHDPIDIRVKEAARTRTASPSWTTMQEDHRSSSLFPLTSQ